MTGDFPTKLPADGLNLLSPDLTTPDEVQAFRDYYMRTKGGLNSSFEFWLEFRPSVLKRHKARTPTYAVGEGAAVPALAALHAYTVAAFSQGVEYEIQLARSMGATREAVLDTLSLAFIHGGHRGMYAAAEHSQPIRDYEQVDPSAAPFPSGWGPRPGFFASGMDFSDPHASQQDVDALVAWYENTISYVPSYVQFAARHRPDHLKAYRNRLEHAVSDSFPAQMVPYLLLHHHTVSGSSEGIRESALLCNALGATHEQLLNAVFSASLHGGAEAYSVVEASIADLLVVEPSGSP